MRHDLSDEALVERFGDILFEIPELLHALRVQEIENRPALKSGGVRVQGRGVSVQRVGAKTRARIGDTRGVK